MAHSPRALVTGGDGFVGRHMIQELRARGYFVRSADILTGEDVRNMVSWGDREIDLLVHCAYVVGGRAGIDGDHAALAKNLALDAAVFEWSRIYRPGRVLYFSSSAVYPVSDQSQKFFDIYGPEMSRLKETEAQWMHGFSEPDADYGFAKLAGERLAENYRRQGGTVSVVRPFSGYGEDQSDAYPFPAICKRAADGDLTVWGPRGQTRDWIHISDVVRGALAVVDSGTKEPVNLCSGVATTMGEIAWLAYRTHRSNVVPVDRPDVTYDEDKPTGVFYRVGDPTRMNDFYSPAVTIAEGVDRMIAKIRRG